METTITPQKAAKILNKHHLSTCAGFYGSGFGGRYFEARVKNGILQVSDFDTWRDIPAEQMKFHDHDGQDIPLY